MNWKKNKMIKEFRCKVSHVRSTSETSNVVSFREFKTNSIYKVDYSNYKFHYVFWNDTEKFKVSELFLKNHFINELAFQRDKKIDEILEDE